MEKKKKYLVYMYTFPNNKKYIGATCQSLSSRQGKHWKKYSGCTALWKAIQEFGYENISTTILVDKEMTYQEAGKLERFYIKEYDTTNPINGYNTYSGGDGVHQRNISEERRAQLREQMQSLGFKNKKVVVSEETREKQRQAKLGKKRGPMPEERKKRIGLGISLSAMTPEGHKRRSDSKKQMVLAIDALNDEQLIFQSRQQAADYFGVRPSAVTRWIDGTRNPKNKYKFYNYSRTTTE